MVPTLSTLTQIDQHCIWHPYTQMQNAFPPIPIVKGQGLYLYAEDGKSYIDGISSWWVNLHGHAHPYIIQKIVKQAEALEHVIFADFTHPPAIELAQRLLPILPGKMTKVFYSDNGSTAVEIALKMAIQYWKNRAKPHKIKIISFKNSYHGDTFGAMSAAGRNGFNRHFWQHLFAVETITPPTEGNEENTFAQLEAILNGEDVACFIFEPLLLGSGGMISYSAAALNHLLKRCREKEVLTIADEVMTGFGRTDTLFACDQLQETPDLICLSKGLTGGFLPLGVTACTKDIFEAFLGDSLQQAFLHGHSYTANPIACSTANGSLDLLLSASCFDQRKMIARKHAHFCANWQEHPHLKRCESVGTILILEFSTTETSYFHSMRDQLYQFFLSKGILLRPLGNVLYVMPPYCISEEELEYIYHNITLTLESNELF
ncbi:MAG: adenosylmethionine--8-amino-7-oxononanoate transaminase [Parachlamydia sp.]|nr:MAG: adenosylmethionine--8-amino-7-oxononanoate transaminase [Parachlamydia sp.]